MKPSSARDRLLWMVFPSLVVVSIYALFFLGARQKALTKAQDELVKAERAKPSPSLIAAKQGEQRQMAQELAKLKEIQAENQKKLLAQLRPFQESLERQSRIEQVQALLKTHQLTILEAGPSAGSGESRLSSAQERLQKMIVEKTGQTPLVYRFHVTGSYGNVHAVLDALGRGDALAIPLGVSMKMEKNRIDWVLVFWI